MNAMKTIRKSFTRFLLKIGFCLPLAALLLLMAAPLQSQEPVTLSPSKVDRKNRAPVSREILRVKLPRPFEAKLKNGLTVLILEDHRAPYINLQLHIDGAGALFEPADTAGLANATALLLREGTKTRSSIEIAETIDRLGAAIGGGSSFGAPDSVLSASGLSDNFDAWLDIIVDVLLHPIFPTDELEKLKQRQRAELREQRSSAGLSPRTSRSKFVDLSVRPPTHSRKSSPTSVSFVPVEPISSRRMIRPSGVRDLGSISATVPSRDRSG